MNGYKRVVLSSVALLLTVAVFAYLYYAETRHQLTLKEAARRSLDAESGALEAQSSGRLEVELFFYRAGAVHPDSDFLVSEKRSVFQTGDPQLNARQIVGEVLKGSEKQEGNVFPENARLRQIYILEDGTAVVDLSREASAELVGGVTSELGALGSVTRSLIRNIREIKQVTFIVEGRPQPTFAGHVSIREPFM